MLIAARPNRSNPRAWSASLRFFLVLILAAMASQSRAIAVEGGIEETPLAARSGPRGATLFTSLPATQTGVITTNAYDDPKMWNEHYHELEIGAICPISPIRPIRPIWQTGKRKLIYHGTP